jgi:hypothetical protein
VNRRFFLLTPAVVVAAEEAKSRFCLEVIMKGVDAEVFAEASARAMARIQVARALKNNGPMPAGVFVARAMAMG